MDLDIPEETMSGFPDSRMGRFAGEVAGIFHGSMEGGRVAFNIPVETSDGIRIVDVGWISDARIQSLRTEPTWSAAPDICANIVCTARPPQQITDDNNIFLGTGAREVWTVYRDGKITRYKPPHGEYILQKEQVFELRQV